MIFSMETYPFLPSLEDASVTQSLSPDLFLSSHRSFLLLPPVLLDQLVVRFEREEANLRKRLKTK